MSFFKSTRSASNRCYQLVNEHSSLVKRIVLFCVLAALMAINLHTLSGSLAYFVSRNISSAPLGFIFPAAICFFLLFCILICLSLFKKMSIDRMFLLSFLTVGTLYTFLFTPTSVPDEITHFFSSYYLSNFLCCPQLQRTTESILFREMDLLTISQIFSNQTSYQTLQDIFQNFRLFDQSQTYIPYLGTTAISVSPLGYVVPALAIALGRLLHLGLFPLFYLGRLSNVLLYCFVVYTAIRRTPVGKPVLFVISFLPMASHLISSYSYDGYTISFSMLLIAECLYWIKTPGTLSKKDILRFCILGVFVTFAKLVYLPLVLLVLLIPSERFSCSPKKAWGIKCGILVGCAVCFMLYYMPSLSADFSSYNVLDEAEETYSISWVLHHIPSTIGIFFRTAVKHFTRYLSELLGYCLGWFQILLDWPVVLPYLIYLILAASIEEEQPGPRATPLLRFVALFSVFCSIGLIFASMFFNWTHVGDVVISGVQGRYFLPLLFPMFLIFENDKLVLKRSVLDCLMAMVIATSFTTVMQIFIIGYL